jgi:hypothetical protein
MNCLAMLRKLFLRIENGRAFLGGVIMLLKLGVQDESDALLEPMSSSGQG